MGILHRGSAAVFILAFCASAQIKQAAITGGTVASTITGTVASFKGIPYAAPPVGDLRWKAPAAVIPWTGTKQAAEFGPVCMQGGRGGPAAEASEDCLHLNVWTAAKTATQRLPVMVWFYGGGFTVGSTRIGIYDGTKLAEKGAVIVTVNYRLGALGFLAHPELSKETGGEGSGNYGIRDMIASLQWVKANISKFGGDPLRVTIFGESAGAIAVSMLTASPAAKGLFHRAISQSGGNFAGAKVAGAGGMSMLSRANAEAIGERVLADLGAKDLAAARALPAAELLKAAATGPNFDGNILPGDQYELYQAGKFNDTPILIGTNADEGAFTNPRPGIKPVEFEAQINAGYGVQADAIQIAYPHQNENDAWKAAKNVWRDSTFAWPTWAWATLQSQKGKGKAFVYYFDHRTPQTPNGPSHTMELPYVFGTLGVTGPGSAQVTPENTKMSDLMMKYWINFASKGDPNGAGLPAWPAFTSANEQVMYFDEMPSARATPNKEQLLAWDSYYAFRRREAKNPPRPRPQAKQ